MLTLNNCRVFTGDEWRQDQAVMIDGASIVDIVPAARSATGTPVVDLTGLTVVPGYIDVQVNGGGGVLFNDEPTVDGVVNILEAHRKFGTTALLPTFITGPTDGMIDAIAAVESSILKGTPGILGIHLEGPFINPAKAGVHDRDLIRRMTEEDVTLLVGAAGRLPVVVTIAPEQVDERWIERLHRGGVLLAAGHSEATYEQFVLARHAGISAVTHLFNAMSPLLSRSPGLVGAALDDDCWCGVIADGFHVDFRVLRLAIQAKRAGRMMLVTDAMPPVGAEPEPFVLGPHIIDVDGGRCVTPDGVLAGSALDMASAVRNCVNEVGVDAAEAIRMASLYPAEFLGVADDRGRIAPGFGANLTILDDDLAARGVVINGEVKTW